MPRSIPKCRPAPGQAESELPQYTFEDCRITQITETKVDAAAKPKTAVTEFYVATKGASAKEASPTPATRAARIVKLHLEQDSDGQWKIVDYSTAHPLEADRD